MNRQQWLEERRKGITGTDVAKIAGFSKWGSPLSVWRDKMGLSEEIKPNVSMRLGSALEPVVADMYCEQTGDELEQGSLVISSENEIFRGTPDFLSKRNPSVGIEIKTVKDMNAPWINDEDKWGEEWTDDVPRDYAMQCHWYAMLTGRQLFKLVAFDKKTEKIKIFHIKKDKEIEEYLKDISNDFWSKYVITKKEPEERMPYDQSYLIERLAKEKSKPVTIDADREINEAGRRLKNIRSLMSECEAEKKEIEEKIKLFIRDAEIIKGDNWQASWKTDKDKTTIDYKKIIEELSPSEEIIKKHTQVKQGCRRFLFK